MITPLLLQCPDTGIFPGNSLPVLFYKQALSLPLFFKGRRIEALFSRNGWTNAWRSGVFTYHHYHSTTHEVLGFYLGSTTLLLGGEKGHRIKVEKGDMLIIPAGVAHKNLGKEDQIRCVGAYPDGRDYDINTGQLGERPFTDQTISCLPIPGSDPLSGANQGVAQIWNSIKNPAVAQV